MWCVSMCIVLVRDRFQLCTGDDFPFLVLSLVLSNVPCAHVVWFLYERGVPLFIWCESWMLLLLQNLWKKIMDNGLCWFNIRFIDELHSSTLICCLLYTIYPWIRLSCFDSILSCSLKCREARSTQLRYNSDALCNRKTYPLGAGTRRSWVLSHQEQS